MYIITIINIIIIMIIMIVMQPVSPSLPLRPLCTIHTPATFDRLYNMLNNICGDDNMCFRSLHRVLNMKKNQSESWGLYFISTSSSDLGLTVTDWLQTRVHCLVIRPISTMMKYWTDLNDNMIML